MQMIFCPLYSSSKGNSTYIEAGHTRILVDAGLSGKMISDALAQIGVLPETLNGILVTHEHSDHVKGVGIISRKYHVPIYANTGTWRAMQKTVGEVPTALHREFDTGESFYLNDFEVLPFAIPHDAAAPVGYRLYNGARSVATATDIGHMTKKIMETVQDVSVLLLESNHDPDLVMENPNYSLALKQRILGTHGHLSNQMCADTLVKLYQTGVRRVVLGHLSPENNTPELAHRTVCETLAQNNIAPDEDMIVKVAWRDRVSDKFIID